ncbi:MAG: aminopeptidase [Candidatus Methanofastidiosia archaeon]|jgi:leucyl aminopeptidase (aminopeptidase T)
MKKAAQFIAATCLNVKDDEDVLIVSDYAHIKMAAAFAENLSCTMVSIPSLTCNGEEPPSPVADLFKGYDVVIALTTLSLGPTDARKKACDKGVRFVSMAGITDTSLHTVMNTDYEIVGKRASILKDIFEDAESITVHTGEYTVEMSVKERHPMPLTGIYTKKGAFGTLPEGEVLISPVEEHVYGTFVVDIGMVGVGFFEQPVTFTVEKGQVVSIEGPLKKKLETILNAYQGSRQIAEFAVGINPAATFNTIFEAKKVEGTCHISLGDNHTIGGVHKSGVHMDGVIKAPTILVDGTPLVTKGSLVIP